jgi:hypothetical protein
MPYRKSKQPPFAQLAKKLELAVRTFAFEQTKEFAEGQRDDFVKRIKDQKFASFHRHPLSPAYADFKERHNLDHRVMIATGHYTESIRVFVRKGKLTVGTFRIGFAPTARARNPDGTISDLLLTDLAAIHEYGSASRSIPARPHWRVYLQDMEARATVFRAQLSQKINTLVLKTLKLPKGK